jgi:hypothetical protein
MSRYIAHATPVTSVKQGIAPKVAVFFFSLVLLLVTIASVGIGRLTSIQLFRQKKVVGRVVSSDAWMPVGDAMVAIESSSPADEKGVGQYVRTDMEGKFAAEIKGTWVSIRVWKPGYSLQGLGLDSGDVRDGEVVIKLREMTRTNWLSVRDDFFELKPGNGFSFNKGEVVSDGSDADIGFYKHGDAEKIILRAADKGGIIFRRADGDANFTNSPVAPLTGYQKELTVDFADKQSSGFFYVRTRDGAHYAKFSFSLSSRIADGTDSYLDFEQPARITWAYQPDGTRNLEIAPDKNTPFPFEEFGFDRSRLTRR